MRSLKFTMLVVLIAFTQLATAQTAKSFQWIGGPTYVLHLGSFKILTDPMFSPKSDTAFFIAKHPTTGALNAPIQRYIAPAKFDTSHIDLLLISHPHADHFDKEAKAALNKQLFVIAPGVNKDLIKSWGFTRTTGLNWGDSSVLVKGDETLRIIAVEAMHAKDEPLKTQLGKGNGYIIEYTRGNNVYRIYWTGDTVWFDEIQDNTKYGRINLLIPDMGSVGSDGKIGRRGLNAQDCLKIVKALNPDRITPVHHTTFSMYVEPISVLQQTLDTTKYKSRLDIIKTGGIIKL
jgi:N-acyl-phosphatidylethanolamine-hydrolysing phospholipase D